MLSVKEYLEQNVKQMKLAEFLTWEEPKQVWGSGGVSGAPRIWIKRNMDTTKRGGYSLITNHAFFREHLPEYLPKIDVGQKSTQIGVGVNIDRQNKIVHMVFDPPKDVPQYQGKMYGKGSRTVNVTNKMLGDDIWTLFDMGDKVTKQFFDFELLREVEERKVWKLTYDPKNELNTQAYIYNQRNKK